MITDPPIDPADPRWLLSALADGEADAATIERGCAAWAVADVAARQSWHAYHLIGDVLRSDDLASAPARDQAFLERLRARLADEPAILAPQPLQSPAAALAPARSRRRWVLPMAMAASVLALATTAVLKLDNGDAASQASQVAQAPVGTVVAVAAAPAMSRAAPSETAPQSMRLVRDAQLDRYLRAHREYGAALPGSLPGGAGSGITAVSFDR